MTLLRSLPTASARLLAAVVVATVGVTMVSAFRRWLDPAPACVTAAAAGGGAGTAAEAENGPNVKIEGHQKKEVTQVKAELEAAKPGVQRAMKFTVRAERVPHDAPAPAAANAKLVHFIRHGEGEHNKAQREWRAAAKPGEPYTIDTDPGMRYQDAQLTPAGVQQAMALQADTAALAPEVMFVSPMRRATKTGLLAFQAHVARHALPVVAVELAHETGGKHTCDKRLAVAELHAAFPEVDYSLIEAEDDPFWGDSLTRETYAQVAARSALFADWLEAREEKHVVVAAHSGFLFSLLTAVLDIDSEEDKSWFGTGEMRTMLLTFEPRPTGA